HCAPVGIEKLQQPPVAKPPLHIPFALGLLNSKGQAIALHLDGDGQVSDTALLNLDTEKQSWRFTEVPEIPVPSLLRNFSAPVIVDYQRSDSELALLARCDTDPFARWEAGQELATRQILNMAAAIQNKQA